MKIPLCVLVVYLLMTISALAQPALNDPRLVASEVVSGISLPTTMAFIAPGDILVLQKNDGMVRRVINGVLQGAPVLDVDVDNFSNKGLLSIATHPSFTSNGWVYLYYMENTTGGDTTCTTSTCAHSRNRVYRYTWNGTHLISPLIILDLPTERIHEGGLLTFGPDGKLYFVFGDLARDGQLQNNAAGAAPDDTGVIFRINDDGSIPTDNPFSGQGGNVEKYYAYGLRNSFGMAHDPVTGKLWMTDNGEDFYDEINLVNPGSNLGWNRIAGPVGRDPEGVSDLFAISGSQYTDPKFSWFTAVGVTGMEFFDSNALGAQYQGDMFVGDVNNGRLYRFKLNAARDGFIFSHAGLSDLVADNGAELQELIFGTGFGGITDLKVGPDGLLYILSFTTGKIFVVSGPGPPVDFDGDRVSDIVVFRGGAWLFYNFTTGLQTGGTWTGTSPGCIPVAMDYDGDGKTDFTQRCGGAWHFYNANGSYNKGIWVGSVAGDLPVPADYDGDGSDDVVIYRGGAWLFYDFATGLFNAAKSAWTGGGGGCIPVPMDYDGDGTANFTQLCSGSWHFYNANGSYNKGIWTGGVAGDKPVPADYDGDGTEDVVVFRLGAWLFYDFATGLINVAKSAWTGAPLHWLGGTSLPAPIDYDGDGTVDFTVYSGGPWHFYNSNGTYNKGIWTGGVVNDRPISRRLLP